MTDNPIATTDITLTKKHLIKQLTPDGYGGDFEMTMEVSQ